MQSKFLKASADSGPGRRGDTKGDEFDEKAAPGGKRKRTSPPQAAAAPAEAAAAAVPAGTALRNECSACEKARLKCQCCQEKACKTHRQKCAGCPDGVRCKAVVCTGCVRKEQCGGCGQVFCSACCDDESEFECGKCDDTMRCRKCHDEATQCSGDECDKLVCKACATPNKQTLARIKLAKAQDDVDTVFELQAAFCENCTDKKHETGPWKAVTGKADDDDGDDDGGTGDYFDSVVSSDHKDFFY